VFDDVIGRQESISAGQHKFEFSRACFARASLLEAVPCFVAVIACTSLIACDVYPNANHVATKCGCET
jgi:hypothetical protein